MKRFKGDIMGEFNSIYLKFNLYNLINLTKPDSKQTKFEPNLNLKKLNFGMHGLNTFG